MEVADISIAGVGAVPLVLALTQIAKQWIPAQYLTLASIAIAIFVVGAAQGFTTTSLMAGLMVGLAASGLWSGGKALAGKGK